MRVLPRPEPIAVPDVRAPRSAPPVARCLALLCGAVLAGGALSGCGVPPELQKPRGVAVPSPSAEPSGSVASPSLPGLPSLPPVAATAAGPSPFPETTAVTCGGRPTPDQVIALVRRTSSILPATGAVSVVTGPVCSGTWQYTVLQIPDREPLQVVSKGPAESMALVTAGTDICNIDVRNYAPPGIRRAASC
jgi:hypothetical protein